MSSRRARSFAGIVGRNTTAIGIIAFFMWVGVTGCGPRTLPVISAPPSVEKSVIGKTKQELLACAAVPPDERTRGDVTELMFYREASQLEESFPVSKGSFPETHHGCLAHVQLKEGRVQSLHYHPVPLSYQDYGHCDEIFASCPGR